MKLFNRQKVLLNTIEELNEKNTHSRRAIVKSQFLLKGEYGIADEMPFYNFFAYNISKMIGLSLLMRIFFIQFPLGHFPINCPHRNVFKYA